MGLMTDMDQNDRIEKMERLMNRGASELLKELKGRRVFIDIIGEVTVLDCDGEWIKYEETDRKGKTKLKLTRTADIDNIEILE